MKGIELGARRRLLAMSVVEVSEWLQTNADRMSSAVWDARKGIADPMSLAEWRGQIPHVWSLAWECNDWLIEHAGSEAVVFCEHGRVRSVAVIAATARLAGLSVAGILAQLGRLSAWQAAKIRAVIE